MSSCAQSAGTVQQIVLIGLGVALIYFAHATLHE